MKNQPPDSQAILRIFEQIEAIPRCSHHNEKIANWLQQWAQNHRLTNRKDDAGNIVIKVRASPGYEKAPIVVLQGHMDMVCEKMPDSPHDFMKDPIQLIYDGDWLKAKATTLGADNGIALALSLAIAEDPGINHPPLELLFTVDEEIGLNGAKHLNPDSIKGRILINLDSEKEGVFVIGCAGGETTSISLPLVFSDLQQGWLRYQLRVSGLRGGHSGVDIHKHRANANKILARALNSIWKVSPIRLVSLNGGTAHNAIAREAIALFVCKPDDTNNIQRVISQFRSQLLDEYSLLEPALLIELDQQDISASNGMAATLQDSEKAINLLIALPHGVMETSASLEGMVETSNNLANISINDQKLDIITSQRSNVQSRLDEITSRIEAIGALAQAQVKTEEKYPAWYPDAHSPLLKRAKEIYHDLYKKDPVITTIHGGLECAVIKDKYEGIDMISIGATIQNPHSPNECVNIPSIGKVSEFLVNLLESIR